ncbi:hypothetical protein [Nocardia sp. NPDC052566]|uniref:nuclear transport factor 2 family protein n=1 Tax=Nocardia sp. NPDC052566 TaxID=3364330 RepID=UPI0037C6B0BC
MRTVPPVAEGAAAVDAGAGDPDAVTVSMQTKAPEPAQDEVPGSEDKTVAMRIVPAVDDAKTMALPIQQPGKPAGTDRVTTPAGGPAPLTKPPSTPRSAPGPKQPGPQGPSAPPQGGPDPTEETRPSAPRPPGAPRQVATAPSPADMQPTLPAQSVLGPRPPQPRTIAPPQRIEPSGQLPAQQQVTPAAPAAARKPRRWLIAVAGAAALVVALIAVIVAVVANSDDNSPEAKVRAVITDYTDALKKGDLATLRSSTCGMLHDYYQGLPEDQFTAVHRLSMERKSVPVVETIDAIRITDNTAIAQAIVYTDADPSKRSARTFDLQRTADGWKVCDQPPGTP